MKTHVWPHLLSNLQHIAAVHAQADRHTAGILILDACLHYAWLVKSGNRCAGI